jgi:hypothetical protein
VEHAKDVVMGDGERLRRCSQSVFGVRQESWRHLSVGIREGEVFDRLVDRSRLLSPGEGSKR